MPFLLTFHLDTPEKARIKTALTLLDHDEFKSDIFREFNISRTTGYRILREPEERDWRTFHNIPGGHETRGRKRKLSDDDDVQTLVRWIRANRWKPDGRKPGYAALPAAAGLDVECNGETVRRALKRSRKFSAHFFHASPLARKRLNCWGVPRCWGAGKQPPGSKRRS
ncbi:hypothetical protein QBC39DRAFT_332047 [Podospora conica]|nr:hypothetical protein QBC39DRAFT_332047 [Schizothecium conicum]